LVIQGVTCTYGRSHGGLSGFPDREEELWNLSVKSSNGRLDAGDDDAGDAGDAGIEELKACVKFVLQGFPVALHRDGGWR